MNRKKRREEGKEEGRKERKEKGGKEEKGGDQKVKYVLNFTVFKVSIYH